jgi:hypothetical protein
MPVKSYEKKDDIPKGFEDDYEEHDGKWVYKDPTADLKESLKKARDQADAAEGVAKKAAKALKAAEQKAEQEKTGVTDEQLQKMRADIRAEVEEELKPKLEQAESLAAENRTLKLDHQVLEMFAGAKMLPQHLKAAWKLHGDEFDLTADGKPMVKGKPEVDVAKHVAALAKQHPYWIQGTKADGGGAGGQQVVLEGGAGDQVGKVDPTERLRAAHAEGAKA